MAGVHDPFEISRAELDSLIRVVKTFGAKVEEVGEEPEGARFIGTFEGHMIRLFPKHDSNFALYFTVAHLYGHMVQLTRPKSLEMQRATDLVNQVGGTLSPRDVQAIYDHEVEAAKIGRALMNQVGAVTPAIDGQYSRMFFADFHYLINFIETKVAGVEAFEGYLRREPIPWRLIEADTRPMVNLAEFEVLAGGAIVV